MNLCLCCDTTLLRHIQQNDLSWYCPQCRQNMPSKEDASTSHSFERRVKGHVDSRALRLTCSIASNLEKEPGRYAVGASNR